jgi:hypothetical protein
MKISYEVISKFLDDDPFDPQELSDALSEPAARALLIDSIVLRRLVQPAESMPVMSAPVSALRFRWQAAAAAAVLFVGLTGGYFMAGRRVPAAEVQAPPASRVVQAVPFTPSGGGR